MMQRGYMYAEIYIYISACGDIYIYLRTHIASMYPQRRRMKVFLLAYGSGFMYAEIYIIYIYPYTYSLYVTT